MQNLFLFIRIDIPKYCEKLLTIHFGDPFFSAGDWIITESQEWPLYSYIGLTFLK